MNVDPNSLAPSGRRAEANVTSTCQVSDLTPKRATVFRMLEHAANNGLKAPTDAEIARAIGIKSLGSANLQVATLAELGLIRIERPRRNARIVEIVATGARTASPPPAKKPARPRRRLRPARAPGEPFRIEMGGGMLSSEERMAKVANGPPMIDRRLGLLKSSFPPARECQWQFGDGPFIACGRPVRPGSSHCPAHHARCWQEYVLVPRTRVGR
jgi:hypothetical protein